MADYMYDLINNRVTIPVWMTTGRTVLWIIIDPYPVYHLLEQTHKRSVVD